MTRAYGKKLVLVCYGVLAVVALFLGLVNIVTYDGLWWSGIAIPGIAYVGLTLRYSILRHANLGKSLLIETIGMQILLVMIDRVLGFEGWSVNYAVPGTILFADAAVVFLIVVNRLNWQSYFMYQIAITVFSFIPLICGLQAGHPPCHGNYNSNTDRWNPGFDHIPGGQKV